MGKVVIEEVEGVVMQLVIGGVFYNFVLVLGVRKGYGYNFVNVGVGVIGYYYKAIGQEEGFINVVGDY